MASFLIPALIAVTTMSLLVAALYLLLFLNNKDKLLQLWGAAWGVYSLRFVIQILVVLHILPPRMVVAQEAATLAGAILCMVGAKALVDKPVASWWWYGAGASLGWVVLAQIVHLPFFWADLPFSFFTGLLFFWSGVIILRQSQIRGPGRTVSGYALILWGIHRADYTFLRPVAWFAPWGFLLAAVLFLAAAIGILLLYYDKIRAELEREIQDRSLAQASLAESEKQLKDIIFSMNDWVWEVDKNGVYTYSSQKGFDLLGKSSEKIVGKTPFDFMPPDEAKRVAAIFFEIVANKAPIRDLENWNIGENGKKICLLTNGVPILDEEGNFKGYRGVDRDITDRKQAEEALRQSEATVRKKLKAIIEPEGDIGTLELSDIIDIEVLQSIMEDFYRITGMLGAVLDVSGKVLIAVGWQDICTKFHRCHPDTLKNCTESDIILTNGVPAGSVKTYRCKNNMWDMVTPIMVGGRHVGNAFIGQFFYEDETPDVEVFREQARRYGFDETEYLAALDRVPRFSRETVEAGMQFYAKLAGIISRLSFSTIRQSRMFAEHKLAEEEKEKLQARLIQAQKMESIGSLAGGIAHDFNNILTSVIGYTELSLDEVEKGTHIEDNLQEVYTAGKRAKALVRQILAFARQSEEELKPIQVDTIATEVLKFIRSSIPTTIEIRQTIESDSLIMGNATQVHQILMNLFTNAAHAMEDKGGILEFSLKDFVEDRGVGQEKLGLKPGNCIEIKVSDTGVGIAPEIMGSIFDPYFTTKGPGEGTGMGLAMVHGIIESYGGKISVDSKPGQGTLFTIYLPVTRKRQEHHPYQSETLPTGKERILFVDDEAPISKVGGQALEKLGYTVSIRTSSIEALELFRSKPNDFDLVITDMTMPNMTGDKLAIELMKIRSDIPVILCTGYSNKFSDETASKIGIKAFAFKPVVKVDLAKTVRKVLDEAESSTQK